MEIVENMWSLDPQSARPHFDEQKVGRNFW